MSEKVKLPKDVCDALDRVKKDHYNSEIIYKRLEHTWILENEILCDVDSDLLMRSLVLGYEPEILQPERELKELFQNVFNGEKDLYDMGYRYGAWDALRIHGIHYDWLEGAE